MRARDKRTESKLSSTDEYNSAIIHTHTVNPPKRERDGSLGGSVQRHYMTPLFMLCYDYSKDARIVIPSLCAHFFRLIRSRPGVIFATSLLYSKGSELKLSHTGGPDRNWPVQISIYLLCI